MSNKVTRKKHVDMSRLSQDASRIFLDEAAASVEGKAASNAPTNSGTLRNSIARRAPSDWMREVYSDTDYGVYVEFGTRPHFPPLEPIKDWARRVIGDEGAAFPIARKISREGTEAQPFLRPALDEFKSQMARFWRRSIEGAYARNKR